MDVCNEFKSKWQHYQLAILKLKHEANDDEQFLMVVKLNHTNILG